MRRTSGPLGGTCNLIENRHLDELICRVRNGSASKLEEAKLRAWRRESFENELHYRRFVEMLDEIAGVMLGEDIDGPPLIEDLLVPQAASPSRPNRRARGWWKGVASMVTAAAVTIFVVSDQWSDTGDPAFGAGEVVTGASESTTVRLGDGSVVRLGPGSRLRVTGDAGSREVWMEGRAYFSVAHDESRPFRIRTHAGDAIVLGTRFDLEARDDDMRVMVVEGAVRMGAPGAQVDIAASEVGEVGDGGAPVTRSIEVQELDQELSWVGSFIAFENTPLSLAADELTRRFGIPVVLLDSALAQETVRATFTDESLEEITRVLCRAVAVHCSVQNGKVTIGL